MAVRMRLTRVGSKKNPIYRVVVADSRSPRDGKFIEIVGRYNPQTDPSTIELDEEKIKDWLVQGRAADRPGRAAAQDGRHHVAVAELLADLARQLVDEPDAVRGRGGRARRRDRPPAPRREGRRRQGDRPPGPDRARAAQRRRARAGPVAPPRRARDRWSSTACASRRSTTFTAFLRRSKRCSPRSNASRSTQSSSAVTCFSGRSPPRSRELVRTVRCAPSSAETATASPTTGRLEARRRDARAGRRAGR